MNRGYNLLHPKVLDAYKQQRGAEHGQQLAAFNWKELKPYNSSTDQFVEKHDEYYSALENATKKEMRKRRD